MALQALLLKLVLNQLKGRPDYSLALMFHSVCSEFSLMLVRVVQNIDLFSEHVFNLVFRGTKLCQFVKRVKFPYENRSSVR